MGSSDNDLVREALKNERQRRSGPNVSLRCPLPDCAHKRDPNLSVHDNGPWKCHRCGATGFLPERGDPRNRRNNAPRADADTRARIQRARDLFGVMHEIQPGDAVDRYLRGRGLVPIGSSWWSNDLKIGRSRHPTEPVRPSWEASAYFCMAAAVRNVAGEIVALHRTWVTADGGKAPVEPRKISFGPTAKAAVYLADGLERIVVGEGIETVLAAARNAPGPETITPVAALHAEGLKHFELPTACRELWVAVDMDAKGKTKTDIFGEHDKRGRVQFGSTGVEAAFYLIRRAQALGIEAHALIPLGKDHCE